MSATTTTVPADRVTLIQRAHDSAREARILCQSAAADLQRADPRCIALVDMDDAVGHIDEALRAVRAYGAK